MPAEQLRQHAGLVALTLADVDSPGEPQRRVEAMVRRIVVGPGREVLMDWSMRRSRWRQANSEMLAMRSSVLKEGDARTKAEDAKETAQRAAEMARLAKLASEEPSHQELVDSLHRALGRKGEPPGFRGDIDYRRVRKTNRVLRKDGKMREALRLKLPPVAAMLSLQ